MNVIFFPPTHFFIQYKHQFCGGVKAREAYILIYSSSVELS